MQRPNATTAAGRAVARARQSAGLSQRALARELGVSRGTISNIESGRCLLPQGLARRIAAAVGARDEWALLAPAPETVRLEVVR